MTLAPWRSALSHALHRNRSLVYARYLQLATVRPNGQPANRTVVFRGFLDGTNQLQFVTDARSAKVEQIAHHNQAEVCWYFPKTREQFRIAGLLTLISAEHPQAELASVRRSVWAELSEGSRLQFAWPDPGKPRGTPADFAPPPPSAEQPLENFCLLLLDPSSVDHLELRGEPQNRWLYSSDDNNNWVVQAVNP